MHDDEPDGVVIAAYVILAGLFVLIVGVAAFLYGACKAVLS